MGCIKSLLSCYRKSQSDDEEELETDLIEKRFINKDMELTEEHTDYEKNPKQNLKKKVILVKSKLKDVKKKKIYFDDDEEEEKDDDEEYNPNKEDNISCNGNKFIFYFSGSEYAPSLLGKKRKGEIKENKKIKKIQKNNEIINNQDQIFQSAQKNNRRKIKKMKTISSKKLCGKLICD